MHRYAFVVLYKVAHRSWVNDFIQIGMQSYCCCSTVAVVF